MLLKTSEMSISSSEGSPLPLDLTAKYQKLAAEYAKVRANVAVLKKAVVDEQTRSTGLKETIKAKDQTIRKHDQELDSLTFRNQQLSKRVLFLQEELDKIQEVSKKNRPSKETGVTAEESKLFQEELQTRILENAKLLSLLDEKERELERERMQWQNSKERYESQITEAQSSLSSIQVISSKPKTNDRTHSATWMVVKDLPFSTLYGPLNVLVESEIGEVVPDLEQVFKVSNQHLVGIALGENLKQLGVLVSRTEKRNGMVHEFLITLRELVSEVIRCLDSPVPYPVSAILDIVDNLYCIALKYKTPGIEAKVLVTLEDLENSCTCFQRILKDLLSSNQCQSSYLNSEEKIEVFERKISKSSKPTTNGPIMEISATDLSPKTITNEFGEGTIIEEPTWIENSVREHIRVMTNSLVTDRQSAESRVTSTIKECEALKSRLQHYCAESSKKNEELKKLQEELSVTSRNYEEQLSSMSEHMANMNDKLAAQEAMIEELTFELAKKENKKSKK